MGFKETDCWDVNLLEMGSSIGLLWCELGMDSITVKFLITFA
jgi:hypothetical protein